MVGGVVVDDDDDSFVVVTKATGTSCGFFVTLVSFSFRLRGDRGFFTNNPMVQRFFVSTLAFVTSSPQELIRLMRVAYCTRSIGMIIVAVLSQKESWQRLHNMGFCLSSGHEMK
mmetsp:Transcript_22350/g.40337  ORF Transcript_22350/g.40337 Transcript_22350/m.40337 type:complete len:114 (+) Transcript_22350:1249-1590(+)